jgi:hypothetical protein
VAVVVIHYRWVERFRPCYDRYGSATKATTNKEVTEEAVVKEAADKRAAEEAMVYDTTDKRAVEGAAVKEAAHK